MSGLPGVVSIGFTRNGTGAGCDVRTEQYRSVEFLGCLQWYTTSPGYVFSQVSGMGQLWWFLVWQVGRRDVRLEQYLEYTFLSPSGRLKACFLLQPSTWHFRESSVWTSEGPE